MNKQTQLIILFFCFIKLSLHLIADFHSGFQGDELLHIETGKHLAFGYMEFPPLIGLLAFIQNLFHSHSVFSHHIFSHLASIIIIIFIAKTTIELGGNNKAVFLVLLGIIIAPSFGRSQQLFQPVVFSQLFWVVSFYLLVRFVKYSDKKSLWLLTFSCIFAFLSKYDAIFFIVGLSVLFLFKRTRTALIRNRFWWHILVAFICILPNIIWQIINDYPTLQMFERLYETQLDGINRIRSLKELLISVNPIVTLLFLFTGIYYLTTHKKQPLFPPLAISIAISLFLLIYKNGKPYYFYPLILTIIPFGALFLEQFIVKKKKWTIYPIVILMLLGSVLIPFGMPICGFNYYISNIYPFVGKEIEGGEYAIMYDEYYTNQKWQTTMKELQSVYNSLSPEEKKTCLIWGKHYAQAGAVNLFREEYNLPKSFSYHGSFYNWAPRGQMPTTIIALSYKIDNYFQPYFNDIKKVSTIYNPYSDNDEELYQFIYICKEPNQDFEKMKEIFKSRIFE